MLCAACNKGVHSRYTLALGKAWHSYHFCCSICRVVLQAEDNYNHTEDQDGTINITCHDCGTSSRPASTTTRGRSGSVGIKSQSSLNSSIPPPASSSPASSPSISPDSPNTSNKLQSNTSPTKSQSTKQEYEEIDANQLFSEDFYKRSFFYRSSRSSFDFASPSSSSSSSSSTASSSSSSSSADDSRGESDSGHTNGSTNHHTNYTNGTSSNGDFHGEESSGIGLDSTSVVNNSNDSNTSNESPTITVNNTNNADDTSNPNDDIDISMFSSDFKKKSYYYRKNISSTQLDDTDLLEQNSRENKPDTPTPSPPTFPRGANAKRIPYRKRLSVEKLVIPTNLADADYDESKMFSDSFYKRRPQVKPSNKRFDFEFKDPSAPSNEPTIATDPVFPSPDTPTISFSDSSNNLLTNLLDNQALTDTLLDTSVDMKRKTSPALTGMRKHLASMAIRVAIPMPFVKKPEPPIIPASTSPSPPLSLPASPSPPPQSSSSPSGVTLCTPPSSPQLLRKPQQPFGLLAPSTSFLSRSTSPPLSLPAVSSKDAPAPNTPQQIRAKIEEEVIKTVMENENVPLSSTSDLGNYNISAASGGSSSSSLLARKRRLKQTHKEATLQRQLSLRKHLVQEVLAGTKLRKAVIGPGSKSTRQELIDSLRNFSITWLRKVKTVEKATFHMQLMKVIREFPKVNKLQQVVGNTTASKLLPTMTSLVWKGKSCFGVTLRDIQYLLRDPIASKDISSRLAIRYRGVGEGSAQIGEVDCIVAIPHEAAIIFASRLSICLRVPLQILQQRPSRTTTARKNKTVTSFPSGRAIYAAGVETLQSREAEEYELWLTQNNCIRPHYRAVVVDDVLDNGSPLVAAMMILRSAGAKVVEMVTILEYQGFGGREKVKRICCVERLEVFDDLKRNVFKPGAFPASSSLLLPHI